jgi:3-deoxy-D-manno-octulosonate 8-phosphate phosphatase (KDO 8-P phosphatase)
VSGSVRTPAREELDARAAAVRLVVFDVDGVLTDGSLYYGAEGEAMKRFDVRDGHAIVLARRVGLSCAALTARHSDIVETRARELGMAAVKQGSREKAETLEELLAELSISADACAYMGDDLNDLAPMARVGLPACPSDAALEVRAKALFVARQQGGRGAARELIELCLKASGRWETVLNYMFHPPGQITPG